MSNALMVFVALAWVLCVPAAAAEQPQAVPAPDDDEPAVVRAEVHGVALEPGTNAPVVVLTTPDKSRYLPIFVGESEAAAIWRYLNKVRAPRPMTHDLLSDVIEKLGGTVRKVTVTELKDGVYYAGIEISIGGKTVTIDARPSDSIALALKTGAEVYVAKRVMDEAGRLPPAPEEPPEENGKEDDEEIQIPTDVPKAI